MNSNNRLRGNPDILLGYIMADPVFKKIKQEHLHDVFLGIDNLLGKTDNPKVIKCAEEISKYFKIKPQIATRLLLANGYTLQKDMNYTPKVTNDGQYVYIRIGAKTTQKDIASLWKLIKKQQKEIGGVGSKSWANTRLAYCIYRQSVINGKPMAQIYQDYLDKKLKGYDGGITYTDINDFRKYYNSFIKGILIL